MLRSRRIPNSRSGLGFRILNLFGIWSFEFRISADRGQRSVVSASKVEHYTPGDLMGFGVLVQNTIDGHAPIIDTHAHRAQKTA